MADVTDGTAAVAAAPLAADGAVHEDRGDDSAAGPVVALPAVVRPAALSNSVLRVLVVLEETVLVGALLTFDGGGATSTLSVGISDSATGFAAAVASAPPQTMQAPLCREFTVPQLGHFQVMAGIGPGNPVWVGLSGVRRMAENWPHGIA